jgi:hypothetical protein
LNDLSTIVLKRSSGREVKLTGEVDYSLNALLTTTLWICFYYLLAS